MVAMVAMIQRGIPEASSAAKRPAARRSDSPHPQPPCRQCRVRPEQGAPRRRCEVMGNQGGMA